MKRTKNAVLPKIVPVVTVFLTLMYIQSAASTCARPSLNTSVFKAFEPYGGCILLKNVCADSGMLISFNPEDRAENMTRVNPGLKDQAGLWNFPARGGANADALVGHGPVFFPPIRPASRHEAVPHLHQPVFSECTLPVIAITDWPYNMGEVFAQMASIADLFFRQQRMIDDSATLVVVTPQGLGLTTFHHVLLSPYSRYPIISFDDLSARPHPTHSHRAAWSQEGTHVSCFARAVLCKMHGFAQPMFSTGATVLATIRDKLPLDPLGFQASGTGANVLRVVFEARSGPTRNIRNLPELIAACEMANAKGFRAGPFTGLSCKVLNAGDTPDLHGVPRFYANVAAVQSAHVLVAVHGAGAGNSVFMNKSSALLEIRPCLFGSTYCGWPNAYMHEQLERAGHPVRFFALNLEDPAQCAPSDYDVAGNPHTIQPDMRARDQHVSPAPAALIAMLRHVAAHIAPDSPYEPGERQGYVMPGGGGVVLGPLCVKNVGAHVASGAKVLQE